MTESLPFSWLQRRVDRRRVLAALVAAPLLAACAEPAAPTPTPIPPPTAPPTPAPAAAPRVEPAPPIGQRAPGSVPASTLPNRLELPAIEVDIPVVELGWHPATDNEGQIFSEWDVAEYAAGWHQNSALPGEPGNVVMSGHNNILGAVFRELDQLKRGDEAVVWTGGRQYTYVIDQVVVLPDKYVAPEQRLANARWIGPFDDHRLTLVSCWPRNDNTHRIVVVAYLQDAQES
jgi:sortase A